MKKIVCELCEGTEFTKDGGFFVCQGCGTKYSLEEARSMMKEVEGDTTGITSSPISMPVSNPNQQQIDNLLILATTAFEAKNNQEAENYCNRVIELDATSYKAWFLKGKAVGWSSSLGNNRVQEGTHSFCKAIEFAPEEEKEDLKDQAVQELKAFGLAMITLRKENFIKNPGKNELNGFRNDRKVLLESLAVLLKYGNDVSIPEGYQEEIASLMEQASKGGYVNIMALSVQRMLQSLGGRKRDDSDIVEMLENCAALMRDAIDASDKDDVADEDRLGTLILIEEHIFGDMTNAPEYKKKEYREKNVKTKAELESLKKRLEEKKIAEAKKAEEEKQARIAAYWEEHSDEKAALEAEKEKLLERDTSLVKETAELDKLIKELKEEGRKKVPSEEEAETLKTQVRELENRKSKLGLFAGKEKKQIGEEIAALQGRLDSLKNKIDEEIKNRDAEVQKKLEPAQSKKKELEAEKEAATKRLTAIETALTKDPEE